MWMITKKLLKGMEQKFRFILKEKVLGELWRIAVNCRYKGGKLRNISE